MRWATPSRTSVLLSLLLLQLLIIVALRRSSGGTAASSSLEAALRERQHELAEAHIEILRLREALHRTHAQQPSAAILTSASDTSSDFYNSRRSHSFGRSASQPNSTAITQSDVSSVSSGCPARERAIAGGDLEHSGVLEAAFARRAIDGELIFLSVGDTRDHRRASKDPALKSISTDFLLNLLANLRALRRDHYLILANKRLCLRLQHDFCEPTCVWSSLWDDHPGLNPWGLVPGDMFVMWAQQWRYIARALELGYRVLRADTDVYFAEDPYPILHSPLLAPFEMVVQQDFAAMLDQNTRPACEQPSHRAEGSAVAPGMLTCGVRKRHLALLNIGLVYLRSSPGGGVYSVINETWAHFLRKLSGPVSKPKHLGGKPDSQALIDQPFMRRVVNELAVEDARSHPPKKAVEWSVIDGGSAAHYAVGSTCILSSQSSCEGVHAQRNRTAFLAQLVKPRLRPLSRDALAGRAERIALAPDWLFGRGCLTHVRRPMALLQAALPKHEWRDAQRSACVPGAVQPAPGAAGGILVATHFVYSKALKRKRAFRAFGWDLGDSRNRSDLGSCWSRSDEAMLFGHTFFKQMDTKTVLCAMPTEDAPACSCCHDLPSLLMLESSLGTAAATPDAARLESSSKQAIRMHGHFAAMEGCNDYQRFWDR